MSIILYFSLSLVSCWFCLLCLIPHLRRQLPDYPNSRSSHSLPIPRGGGVAFLAVSSIFAAFELLCGQGFPAAAIPLLAIPLAFIGLLDDRHNLPSSWRFGAQLFTSVLIFSISPLASGIFPAVVDLSFYILSPLRSW